MAWFLIWMQTLCSCVNTHTEGRGLKNLQKWLKTEKVAAKRTVQRRSGQTKISLNQILMQYFTNEYQWVACFSVISMFKTQIPDSLTEEIYFSGKILSLI